MYFVYKKNGIMEDYFLAKAKVNPKIERILILLHLVILQNFGLLTYFDNLLDRMAIKLNISKACNMKINPRIIICIVILKPFEEVNWGKKAIKNKATLGFNTFIRKPFFINFENFMLRSVDAVLKFILAFFSFVALKAK